MRVKNRRWLVTAVLASLMAGCSVQGNGQLATQTYQLQGFNELSIGGDFTSSIEVLQTDSSTLAVTTDSNVMPHIRYTQQGNRLTVYSEKSISPTLSNLEVKSSQLQYLTLSGSNDAQLNLGLADQFELEISGSAKVFSQDLDVQTLLVDISGSGDVTASGKATTLNLLISGSGTVDFSGLDVGAASVEVSGSGKVLLGQVEKLDVAISGSGEVQYQGEARVQSRVSGSGQIYSVELK